MNNFSQSPSSIKDVTLESFLTSRKKNVTGLSFDFKSSINFFNAQEREKLPKHVFVLVSGTSESGKSYFGDSLFESGTANRLKFYKLLADTLEYKKWINSGVQNPDPFKFAKYIENDIEIQSSVFCKILSEVNDIERQTKCSVSSFETIKHPWIVNKFKNVEDSEMVSLFIDASFESRVKREQVKTGKTLDEVRATTVKKDKEKVSYGNLLVSESCDLIIYNDGTKSEYNEFISLFKSQLLNISNNENSIPIDNTKLDLGQLFIKVPETLEQLESEIRKKFGLILLKPDTINMDLSEFSLEIICKRLKTKGVILIGSHLTDGMKSESVGSLYPDLNENYFNAYKELYSSNKTLLLIFESRAASLDVWSEMLKIRGLIGDNKFGKDRSLRSFIPFPGKISQFDDLSKKIKENKLEGEDYKLLSENLAHVPDNLQEFCGLLSLIPEEDGTKIFGDLRFKKLEEIVKRNIMKRNI